MSRKLFAAAVCLTCAACISRVTGNEGNLAFSYVADDRVGDFNKPIAVGGRLDLTVEEAGRLKQVPVVSATSGTPDTLTVVGFTGSVVTVEGKAPGSALLEVEATVAGQNLPDSVNLLVAQPEVLKLRHLCTESRTGLYFVDQDVHIPFDMSKANGQPVIGYGVHPVTVEPADALTLDATTKDQATLHFKTRATPGEATIRSTVDDTTLDVTLVTEAQIDGGKIFAGEADAVQAGHKAFRLVWPTVGGQQVCQPKLQVEVVGATPDVCAVSAAQTAREDDATGTTWGWVEIDAQKAGTCSFDVTWPGGNDGAGATERFDLVVN